MEHVRSKQLEESPDIVLTGGHLNGFPYKTVTSGYWVLWVNLDLLLGCYFTKAQSTLV